ncbi:MAG: CRISPR-associated endonuclease Cas1, partial [Candidatus Competibacteraceae bacterium]|nr:CRISPR-associated endonuclease Cas1 [Candidatus Competibacteraceae bacterium]
ATRRRLHKGLPQGSPLSPLLSNLYLDHLDEALVSENLRLVRYADDFLILCKHQEQAEEALELTADVLAALRLTLNQAKTRIIDFERGFRFLGVQFVRSLVLQCRYPETTASDVDKNLPQTVPATQLEHVANTSASPDIPATPGALALALQEALAEQPDELPAANITETAAPNEREPSSANEPHLQTLYITEHGCVLGKQSERFIVRREGQVIQEIPALKVDQIMIFGNSQITTQAMQFCLLEKIPIVLLSGKGRYFGVVDSMDTDPVLLHRDQFACAADDEFCLRIAKAIVQGKLANMRLILRRYARKREAEPLRQADTAMRGYSGTIDQASTLDQLRGYEGAVSKFYFQGLRSLLTPDWGFDKRVRQPPTDPVNSLLSYGYTLLFYNVYSLARARGINAHVGFLHPLRAGHPALISDLMEEFRALVVDALVLNLILNKRLTPTDFLMPEKPGAPCLLSDSARKQFIHAFEQKMNATVTHPLTGLQLDYRRCIDQQVQLMAAVIRGRRERYQAMVLR